MCGLVDQHIFPAIICNIVIDTTMILELRSGIMKYCIVSTFLANIKALLAADML